MGSLKCDIPICYGILANYSNVCSGNGVEFIINFSIYRSNVKKNIFGKKDDISILLVLGNDKNVEIKNFSVSESESIKYYLKFTTNEEIEKKVLSTLYIKLNNETIGSCEIVIVKDIDVAKEEMEICKKNITYFEKTFKDKNLGLLENQNFSKNLFEEKQKKIEYEKDIEKFF
jgi:hypothetical protein